MLFIFIWGNNLTQRSHATHTHLHIVHTDRWAHSKSWLIIHCSGSSMCSRRQTRLEAKVQNRCNSRSPASRFSLLACCSWCDGCLLAISTFIWLDKKPNSVWPTADSSCTPAARPNPAQPSPSSLSFSSRCLALFELARKLNLMWLFWWLAARPAARWPPGC